MLVLGSALPPVQKIQHAAVMNQICHVMNQICHVYWRRFLVLFLPAFFGGAWALGLLDFMRHVGSDGYPNAKRSSL